MTPDGWTLQRRGDAVVASRRRVTSEDWNGLFIAVVFAVLAAGSWTVVPSSALSWGLAAVGGTAIVLSVASLVRRSRIVVGPDGISVRDGPLFPFRRVRLARADVVQIAAMETYDGVARQPRQGEPEVPITQLRLRVTTTYALYAVLRNDQRVLVADAIGDASFARQMELAFEAALGIVDVPVTCEPRR